MRNRNTHINVRTTPQEKAQLEWNAELCGLSVSEFLRKLANGYNPQPAPTKEYFELTRLLTDMYADFRITGNDVCAKLIADTLLELQSTIAPVKCNGNDKYLAGS